MSKSSASDFFHMKPTPDVHVSVALVCLLLLWNAPSLQTGLGERTRVYSEKEVARVTL